MSEHIFKKHNKTLILYHIVCPAKYRRKVFSKDIEKTMKEICIEISKKYEINFVEIGIDEDHAHFLVQSIPILSPSKIVKTIKGITSREIFMKHPEIKKFLWGGNLWTSGYYLNTVGQFGNEKMIREYVENQGRKYEQIHRGQLSLFDTPQFIAG